MTNHIHFKDSTKQAALFETWCDAAATALDLQNLKGFIPGVDQLEAVREILPAADLA